MDLVLELLIQLVVQVFLELIGELLIETAFRGIARVLLSAVGRAVVGAAAGFGFGVAWGTHLSGGTTWPKLLWVSFALAVVSAVRAMAAPRERDADGLLIPPWRWPADRLLVFSLLNVAVAAGIVATFRPGLV